MIYRFNINQGLRCIIADTLSRSTLKSAAVSEATWDNEELIFKVFQTYEAVNPKSSYQSKTKLTGK